MKIIDFLLVLITTIMLTANQVFLKLWLGKYIDYMLPFNPQSFGYLIKLELIISIISFLIAIVIWLSLLNKLEFSLIYPLISMSYVFGMVAAKYVFHEQIPSIRWIGVALIVAGVFFISRK